MAISKANTQPTAPDTSKELVYYVATAHPYHNNTYEYTVYLITREDARELKRLGEQIKKAENEFFERTRHRRKDDGPVEKYFREGYTKKIKPLRDEYHARLALKVKPGILKHFTTVGQKYEAYSILELDEVKMDKK